MAAPCAICGVTRKTKKLGPFYYCRDHQIDYSAAPAVLAQQLEHAHHEQARLASQLRTFEAVESAVHHRGILDSQGRRDETDWDLLGRTAAAFLLAHEAENAHTSSALHDGPPTTDLRDTSRPSPGSSTHPARKRANELRQSIRQALDVWDQAVELRFQRPPKPSDDIPKVRCRVSDCPARDVWVPAWRRIRGRKQPLYHERCASCGTPYQPTEREEAS